MSWSMYTVPILSLLFIDDTRFWGKVYVHGVGLYAKGFDNMCIMNGEQGRKGCVNAWQHYYL